MAKRFTEIKKWDDPWFRKLTPEQKLFWIYICDNCDNAGVWKVDFEMASFQIGKEITLEIIPQINNGKVRLMTFDEEHLLLVKDFINFQIGNLAQEKLTNLQKSSLVLMTKYIENKGLTKEDFNLTSSLSVAYGYKYKGKGKGKGNIKGSGNSNKGIIKGKNNTKEAQDYFYQCFKEVFNKDYIADFGKDGKIFKDLLVIIPLPDLKNLINAYLSMPDEFSEKVGYTVGLFRKRINSLRVEKRSLKYGEKGLKAVMAGVNWLKGSEVIDVK